MTQDHIASKLRSLDSNNGCLWTPVGLQALSYTVEIQCTFSPMSGEITTLVFWVQKPVFWCVLPTPLVKLCILVVIPKA